MARGKQKGDSQGENIFGRGRKACRKVALWSEVAKQLHLPMHERTGDMNQSAE